MWIASKFGFFSMVKKGEEWHVRARAKKDLNNLLRAVFPKVSMYKVKGIKILSWDKADYKYRIVIDARVLSRIFMVLEDTLDYDNFKAEVGKTAGQKNKLDIYHHWWSDMRRYQSDYE